ncbi:hypothetical protein WQ57_21710 [Mesobacillus campisalis]|uniref:Calcineurin-like phosphoesterase domain-containing protein n=1 Tax=Mesobacillus campisalis TaxID=1408103 RepID=A0A0M2SP29_9BACI|nr:DNA repair exonuclease [Mesobacillus campisalis]KKK35998.1 hypothetical protein WQ57_21710 [Mesobacillus campisalis]
MKQVTFMHWADLHLDSPFKGLKHLPENIFKRLQDSTFKALANMTDEAIQKAVDFVIIAGDVFDGENRSLRAQARFRGEMAKLAEKGIPAYIIHGNHDHLGGTWMKLEMPENVHIFAGEVEIKKFAKQDETTVHLYGFSYPERHLTDRWIDRYQKKEGADFHIGILHGHFEGASDHDKYAPFRLGDLYEKQFDYWALGHIHKRQVLSEEPPVIYPGNPQGRNPKEQGEKGFYTVSLTERGTRYEFLPSHDVQWLEMKLDFSQAASPGSLFDACRQAVSEVRSEGKGVILSLEIEHAHMLDPDAETMLQSGELLEILQEEEKDENSFVWVRDLTIGDMAGIDRNLAAAKGDFFEDLFSEIDGFDRWHEGLMPLFSHNAARRHLEGLNEEEKKQVLLEAETRLLQLLAQD